MSRIGSPEYQLLRMLTTRTPRFRWQLAVTIVPPERAPQIARSLDSQPVQALSLPMLTIMPLRCRADSQKPG